MKVRKAEKGDLPRITVYDALTLPLPSARIRAPSSSIGHKNIRHTVRYTELAASKFKNFWKD